MVTPLQKTIKALPHSPPYMMHKFWARRPHNVFRELIAHYTKQNSIILDPFCGGGVTVVEGLQLRRRVVGVDINPLATYITEMEVTPTNLDNLYLAYDFLSQRIKPEILTLYRTKCRSCGGEAICDWIEWANGEPAKIAYICPICKAKAEAEVSEEDKNSAVTVGYDFEARNLWYPDDLIPLGDKTEGLVRSGITRFHQLFTKRNLFALALLWQSINAVPNEESRDFLRFIFSSTLKWASRQSHRRQNIIEGWAMHAYWLYPRELEINVWNTFARRFIAVSRGKKVTNLTIGDYYRKTTSFEELLTEATCLILTQSSTSLPIPNNMVDAVITDPPYGGNVNYGELADYWSVWHRFNGRGIIDKSQEIIVNEHQGKVLLDYKTLLEQVFAECYRVLKPEGACIVTFNNTDLSVVAAFIEAVAKAGFVLHPEGLLYQPPIKAYTTTFHAKDLGAFTGDFIFTFCKENRKPTSEVYSYDSVKHEVEQTILQFVNYYELHRHTQADLRQRLYRALLPFLASYVNQEDNTYWEVVRELRQQLRSLDKLLPGIRAWCRNHYTSNIKKEGREKRWLEEKVSTIFNRVELVERKD